MSIFNVLSLIGGLSLFLFGMGVMGEGLEKQAGGALNSILQKLTANRIKGFLLGVVVTGVIQSSSATTVMVVGFVNSGIMKLSQAIGIIMGANVGTTVTAWILSLTGIEGDSLVMQLLKPSSFTPVLAMIGAILYLFCKTGRKKDIGTILLGFAVLMFGMESMSAAVKPLQDVPEFANILLLFSNPLFGVLAGALITAVIQSSSASVGILQALSATGSITYASAVPIVLGQNIGTCVTAMLSSIGTNRNARRAAIVHLYFNILGTTIFLIGFYGINAVVKFAFINDQATAFGIALTHTAFNLISTAILLPFCKVLEKLAYLTIPEDEGEKEKFQLLDDRLLLTPAIAISQSKTHSVEMAHIAQEITLQAMDLIGRYDAALAEQVSKGEKMVDKYEDKLGTYLVKLNDVSLAVEDGRDVARILNTIGEFERISDHAVNIMEVAREMHQKGIEFSEEGKRELDVITGAVREILQLSVDAFIGGDVGKAKSVEPLEQVIDGLRNTLKNRHIKRLQDGSCTIEMGFIYVDLLTNYERIADHCSNIAICVIESAHGTMEPHEYLRGIRKAPDEQYSGLYQSFSEKYAI